MPSASLSFYLFLSLSRSINPSLMTLRAHACTQRTPIHSEHAASVVWPPAWYFMLTIRSGLSAQASIVGAQSSNANVRDFFKLLGTFLGRYRLGERVHDSATATAVRATDVRNNTQVAL